MYLAIEAGLEIIPVLNKIDLKGAKPEQVSEQIQNLYPVEDDGILKVCIQEKKRIGTITFVIVCFNELSFSNHVLN